MKSLFRSRFIELDAVIKALNRAAEDVTRGNEICAVLSLDTALRAVKSLLYYQLSEPRKRHIKKGK